MRRYGLFFSAIFVLATLLPCSAAFAQTKPHSAAETAAPDTLTREARERWDEGVRALDRADYEAARVAFKQTYALKPVEEVLRNLGAAEVLSGHAVEGARHLSEYLRVAIDASTEDRANVEAVLSSVTSQVAVLDLQVEPQGAELVVDGELIGRSPLGFEWYVAPGEHRVLASKSGYQAQEQAVTLGKGEARTITLELSAAPAGAESSAAAPYAAASTTMPPPDSAGGGGIEPRTIVLIAGASITAAALGLGIATHLQATSAEDDAAVLLHDATEMFGSSPCASAQGQTSPICGRLHDKNRERADAAQLSHIGFAVAGIAAAGTVAAYVLWPEQHAERAAIRPRPWVNASGAGLHVSGVF